MSTRTTLAPLRIGRSKEKRWAALFLSPWVIGFVVLTVGPMIASLYFSFTRYSIIDNPVWLGLDNYVKLFTQDPKFYSALGITFGYSFLAIPLGLVLGFLLAYMLNLKIPGTAFWRTIFYMPSVISGVVVAILWRGLFDAKFGFINWTLSLLGIQGPEWLLSPEWALIALVLISLWGVGGGMIIYLAGLQAIPTSLYEAAEIDGCSRWQHLRKITLPMMSPIIFYNLVIGIISCFQYFTEAWVLTRGGPAEATQFYNIYIYKTAFSYLNMGYASSMAWVLFFIVLALTAVVFKSSSLWVYYEGEVKKS